MAILKKDAKSGPGSRPALPLSLYLASRTACLRAARPPPFRGRFQEDTWAVACGQTDDDDGGGQRENFLQFASLCMTVAAFVRERGDKWIWRVQHLLMTKKPGL